MQPEIDKYLHDMLDSLAAIEHLTRNHSLDDYLQTRAMRDAVQWNFCVIGEALSKLSKFDPTVAAQIHEFSRIIAFRNQLIHGYGVINHTITWAIITEKLPILRGDIEVLLNLPPQS